VSNLDFFILIVVFFLTSVLSVVTGSGSLITVPAMISLGMEPHVAVATNMLALTFMSIGGALPFLRQRAIHRTYLMPSIVLTLIGSGLGAFLLVAVPIRAIRLTVAVAMITVTIFTLWKKDLGLSTAETRVSRPAVIAGYVVTFLLAVYGGFFSGGYVTILTAAFIVLFGMTFLQAVATTKVMNIFSSAIATAVFLWQGIVNLRLGIILGAVMFLGALLGGQIALQLSAVWLRRIFVIAVLGLAVKMLWP
jgi:uncharacterized protein